MMHCMITKVSHAYKFKPNPVRMSRILMGGFAPQTPHAYQQAVRLGAPLGQKHKAL